MIAGIHFLGTISTTDIVKILFLRSLNNAAALTHMLGSNFRSLNALDIGPANDGIGTCTIFCWLEIYNLGFSVVNIEVHCKS